MSGENKFFLLNKNEDYTGGVFSDITLSDGCVRIAAGKFFGCLFSPILDTGDPGTLWDRVVIDGVFGKDSYFEITFYCFEIDAQRERYQLMLEDKALSLSEIAKALNKFRVITAVNAKDILLQQAKGKYLLFKLDFFGQEEDWPSIRSIKISFPKRSVTKYLPEIYQTEGRVRKSGADSSEAADFPEGKISEGIGFLDRYLSIFSSMYFDLEEDIDRLPACFDPDGANHEMLLWIAELLNVEEAGLWQEECLRRLVKNAVRLYQKKGTLWGICTLIELITLHKPYIVESFTLRKYRGSEQQNTVRLYGENPYGMTILIPENAVATQKEFKALNRMIEFYCPVNMEHVLIELKNILLLGHYTYLGVNSYLQGYSDIIMDESVRLSFVKIGQV